MGDKTATFNTIQYRVTDHGVALITIDVPGNSVNVLTPELHREVGEVAAVLAADDCECEAEPV